MTTILFCNQPFAPSEVDADFAAESLAAKQAGFEVASFDHTKAERDPARAASRVREGAGSTLYRGWMFRAARYEAFCEALRGRGTLLVNDPGAYRTCHHLPESYALLEGETPRTVWLPVRGAVDWDAVFARIQCFGAGPLIVKDYVKSQKHAWKEACFIPRADDADAVKRVVQRFLDLQGEDLAEGLVFREYVPLRIVGTHPKSGMPLGAEVRTFWLDGALVLQHAYWADLGVIESRPPLDWLHAIARRVPSRFFTMDVALREDGRWTVIELGDGQVAGLPSPSLAPVFYERLRATLDQRA